MSMELMSMMNTNRKIVFQGLIRMRNN